ncbi:MAG: hypothetical protein Q9160_004975 [Pyrenula sp. 1 TL-2023]
MVGAVTHQVIKASFPVASASTPAQKAPAQKAPAQKQAFGADNSASIAANLYNPFSLNENCVHIAMGYLLDMTAHDLVALTEHMQSADGKGGLSVDAIKGMLSDAAAKKNYQYRFDNWHVGSMPPHDEICEQNDTEKWAMLYTRKDGTGHCVVFDETKPTGYLDFQASGQPIPMQADSGEYIDDNGKYFFLFKTKL